MILRSPVHFPLHALAPATSNVLDRLCRRGHLTRNLLYVRPCLLILIIELAEQNIVSLPRSWYLMSMPEIYDIYIYIYILSSSIEYNGIE